MNRYTIKLSLLPFLVITVLQLFAQYDWRPKACLPAAARHSHTAFSVNGKGYIVGGILPSSALTNEVWMYDPTTNTWTRKKNFPNGVRIGQCSFVINGVAYVGLGSPSTSSVYVNEFFRYDDATDNWISIANFGGSSRSFSMAFALNGKGYVGCGKGAGLTNDLYEYDPVANTWTKKASFPGVPRQKGIGLSVGGFGYMGLGVDSTAKNDIYRYDATTDTWTPIANFGGGERYNSGYFVLHDTAYVAGGRDPYTDSCWRYNQGGNAWVLEKSFTCVGPGRVSCAGFSINNFGYIFGGEVDSGQFFFKSLLQFGPTDNSFIEPSNILGNDTSFCGVFSTTLSTGVDCTKWSTGATGPQITVTALGDYWCTYPDTCGMMSDTIHITQGTSNSINFGPDTTYCGVFTRIISTGDPSTVWSIGTTAAQITVSSPGTYSAVFTNECGVGRDTIRIFQNPAPVITLGNDTELCTGQTLLLDVSSANSTYRWQNNATGSTFNISATGIYSVTVTNNLNCSASDTVNVTFATQPPIVNLGNDTTYCGPFSRLLSTGNNKTLWSTGTTAAQITASSPSTYTATLSNGCGTTSDNIIISQSVAPLVALGNDTTLCTGEFLVLDATNSNATYKWQDNSTNLTLSVIAAGTYSVTVTNSSGCVASDTIQVNYQAIPLPINLGQDTIYCASFTRTLVSGDQNTLWSTGAVGSQITVTTAGLYWGENANGCDANRDSIVISQYTTPTLQLTGGGSICQGDVIPLQATTNGTNILWSTGANTNSISATQPGSYIVETWNNIACINRDSVIIPVGDIPQFSLGNDTLVCSSGSILLNIPLTNVQYLWQDNTTDSFYRASVSGSYSVTVSNNCGSSSDQINIEILRDDCQLLIPTGFSPNGDGMNDLFRIKCFCPVQSYHLKVFNRWGQLVFESTSLSDSWDGTYKDIEQPISSFVYEAQYYNYCEKKIKTVGGTVTLVK